VLYLRTLLFIHHIPFFLLLTSAYHFHLESRVDGRAGEAPSLTPLILNPFSLFDNPTFRTLTPPPRTQLQSPPTCSCREKHSSERSQCTRTGVFVTAGAVTVFAFAFASRLAAVVVVRVAS